MKRPISELLTEIREATMNYPSSLDEPITRATMKEVVVPKDKLLETLKANKDTHRATFETALEGYRTRSVELLEEHIARIRAGKVERVFVQLPLPEDHTDDYERAIESLEWSIFDEVHLSITEFDQYVRDNWAWKGEFLRTSAMYTPE